MLYTAFSFCAIIQWSQIGCLITSLPPVVALNPCHNHIDVAQRGFMIKTLTLKMIIFHHIQ